MTVPAIINTTTTVNLMLDDGDGTKFPRARVYDDNDVLVTTLDLTHVAFGHYTVDYTFTVLGNYFIVFIVYEDALHTVESVFYTRTEERYHVAELDLIKADLTTFSVKQAWTRNPPNMLGTFWLEKNGQRVLLIPGDSLTYAAKIGLATVFSGASVAPTVDGRYNETVPYLPTPGTLIDIDAEITTVEGTFKTQVSLSVPKLSA